MESKKIVLQRARNKFEKLYLTCHWESNVIVCDLLTRHARLRHQGRYVDARLSRTCAGEARYHTGRAWSHLAPEETRLAHETFHRPAWPHYFFSTGYDNDLAPHS
jgi:hypothetical protein